MDGLDIGTKTRPDQQDNSAGRLAPFYHNTLPKAVAGKSLVLTSAFGTGMTLLSVAQGNFGRAALIFILGILVLSMMLERAVSRFHDSRRATHAAPLSPMAQRNIAA